MGIHKDAFYTKDALRTIIRETVSKAVEDRVDASLAPLKAKQTNWMAKVMGGASLQAPAIRGKDYGKDPAFLGRTIVALAKRNVGWKKDLGLKNQRPEKPNCSKNIIRWTRC